jgi:hypothetical protein
LPRRRQTRQRYDEYFLSIKAKKRVIFTEFYKVAPGCTNLLFTPIHGKPLLYSGELPTKAEEFKLTG